MDHASRIAFQRIFFLYQLLLTTQKPSLGSRSVYYNELSCSIWEHALAYWFSGYLRYTHLWRKNNICLKGMKFWAFDYSLLAKTLAPAQVETVGVQFQIASVTMFDFHQVISTNIAFLFCCFLRWGHWVIFVSMFQNKAEYFVCFTLNMNMPGGSKENKMKGHCDCCTSTNRAQ